LLRGRSSSQSQPWKAATGAGGLCALDPHRQGLSAVDLRRSVGLVEPPSRARVGLAMAESVACHRRALAGGPGGRLSSVTPLRRSSTSLTYQLDLFGNGATLATVAPIDVSGAQRIEKWFRAHPSFGGK